MQTETEGVKKHYSLLELTESLQSIISKAYSKSYWIKAEIAKLNYYPKSGHCYPDLVEKKEGKILAQMRATIWASTYDHVCAKFKRTTKEILSEGMTVLLNVKVNFHPIHSISLHVLDIEPSFTLGEMARDKALTIEKLKKEGIFDQNKRIRLPLLPQRIAVISVETSKGYRDFLNVIENNNWGYQFFHLLFPAILQGDKAVGTILTQLDFIKSAKQHFDIVIIIRGGGGDIGLNCYDHYDLAKAIAFFPLPVLTGIGHATNETVVEMVAHKNSITPTAAAQFLIQQFHNFAVRIEYAQNTIISFSEKQIENEQQRLNESLRLFKSSSLQNLSSEEHQLDFLSHHLASKANSLIMSHGSDLRAIAHKLDYKPKEQIKETQQYLSQSITMLGIYSDQLLKIESTKVNHMNGQVSLLDPKNTLKRGYSISFKNGKVVKNAKDLSIGEVIETELSIGRFSSIIKSTK